MKRAYQPVYEMANSISAKSNLSVDNNTLKKVELTQPLKTIDDPEERREILKMCLMLKNRLLKVKMCCFLMVFIVRNVKCYC